MWIKLLKDYQAWKAGEIVETDDVIARAYVQAGYAEETKTPENALMAAVAGEIAGQMKAVTDELTKGLKAIADDLKKAGGGPRIEPGEAEADRTKSLNDCIKHIGLALKHGNKDSAERLEKVYRARRVDEDGNLVRGHEGAAGSTGGYLVAEEYGNELMKVPGEMASFASRVRSVPMGGQVKKYPVLRQTNTPASNASAYHAGIRTYYKSEKAARTESDAGFDEIKLEAKDLIAYTTATRDLLADAPGAEADFLGLIRDALAWRRDYEYLRGPGGGRPLGVFNAPALISVTREDAGEISVADTLNMLAKLLPSSWGTACWWTNVTCITKLAALKDDAGNALWLGGSGSAQDALPPRLWGRPVFFTEKVPVLGTAGDLNLFDPAMYLEGLRAGVEIGVSEEFLFSTDQIAYRAKIRHDGAPWIKGKIKQADGASTEISPFTQLGAAA